MKLNSLVDRRCIRALYRASQAGVPVDLNIQDLAAWSRWRAGRLGERPRQLGGRPLSSSTRGSTPSSATARPRSTIGSADLMPRNLDTRVELVTPVEDPSLRRSARHTRSLLADDRQPGISARTTSGGPAHAAGTRAALGPARAHARPPGARPRAPPPPIGTPRSLSASSRAEPALQQACPVARSALAVALAVLAGSAGCGGGAGERRLERASRAPGPVEGGQMLFGTSSR
jgi:hypothetical protein